MSETEITIKVKIFDDPEYCMDEKDFCNMLYTVTAYREEPRKTCMIFNDGYEPEELFRENGFRSGKLIKCEQCKEALKQAIYEKFRIYDFDNWTVKEVDERILVDEMEQLMSNQPADWGHKVDKLGIDLMFLNQEQAEVEFLKRFYELKN